MKRLLILSLFILSLNITSNETKVYKFVGANFPGVLYQGPDGLLQGSSVKVIKEASEKLQFKYSIHIYPWIRATQMVMRGEADILIGPYKTITREEKMLFTSNHLYEDKIVLVAHKNNEIKWKGNLLDIQHKKFGMVRGWSLGKKFEQHSSKLDITIADSTQKLLEMLYKKRLDIIIVHNRSFNEDTKISSTNLKKITVLSPPLSNQRGYFAFSKKNKLEDFLKEFDKFIKVEN